LQGAQVKLTNTGTTAERTAITDAGGDYAFQNIEVAFTHSPSLRPGLKPTRCLRFNSLLAETRRLDTTLKPGAETQTVVVVDDPTPVITTDVSNLAETKLGDELVELPVAIYSRSTGSTSPISTLTTEAGVQTDDSGRARRCRNNGRAALGHRRWHFFGWRGILRACKRNVPLLQFH